MLFYFHDTIGYDLAAGDRTGQDRTGQDRTGQDRTGLFVPEKKLPKFVKILHTGKGDTALGYTEKPFGMKAKVAPFNTINPHGVVYYIIITVKRKPFSGVYAVNFLIHSTFRYCDDVVALSWKWE